MLTNSNFSSDESLQVSLKFNKETVQPAEQVELVVTADPRSLVNILAVDKSILLLKTGNDITVQDVSLLNYNDIESEKNLNQN